jgi:hypothetical protein
MHFIYRLGRPSDIPHCLNLLTSSPFASPSHHDALVCLLKDLPPREEMIFVVVEDKDKPALGIAGFALSFYVTDQFIETISSENSPSRLWTELVCQHNSKHSPILSQEKIGKANAGRGLLGFSPFHIYNRERIGEPFKILEDKQTKAYFNCITKAFVEAHQGNNHRAFYKEIFHESQLIFNQNNGYILKRDFENELFLIEATRHQADQKFGGWLSPIFDYNEPKICFTNRQRELLRFALLNNRLNSLSENLGIENCTVKDLRLAILDKAEMTRSKRETFEEILCYVKTHPEELRPFAK